MADTKITIPLQVISIPPNGLHLIIKAKINNRVAYLVLDTGASQTVLDSNRIDRFMKQKKFKKTDGHTSGIGGSKLKSHLVQVKKMLIGKIIIRDMELVLMDLVHVNNSYAMIKEKPVDGILGGDILNQLSAIINYAKKDITFVIKQAKSKSKKKQREK